MALKSKLLFRKRCYFYQNNECILNNKICYPCSQHIVRINGIDHPSDYINFVSNRKNNRLVLWLSFFSLLVSLTALVTTVFEDEFKDYYKKRQLPTKNISNKGNIDILKNSVNIKDSVNLKNKSK